MSPNESSARTAEIALLEKGRRTILAHIMCEKVQARENDEMICRDATVYKKMRVFHEVLWLFYLTMPSRPIHLKP